jgi:hypothetical protein
LLNFRSKTNDFGAQIVQISEDNLPVVKIDLRTWSSRRKHYVPEVDSNASINRFALCVSH